MAHEKKKPRKRTKSEEKLASTESLMGLRDVLDLTLTRVIEDDMNIEEARALLAHLEKEVVEVERGIRRAKKRMGGKREEGH